MPDQTIHGPHRIVSASKLLDAMGKSLSVIKEQDDLTDAELGAVMHKGADQGAKYRTALAEMGAVAFLRACQTWNGRFANGALALIGMKLTPLVARPQPDRSFGVMLSRLKLAVDVALEDDNQIDDDELAAMRSLLIDVGAAIDARLQTKPSGTRPSLDKVQ